MCFSFLKSDVYIYFVCVVFFVFKSTPQSRCVFACSACKGGAHNLGREDMLYQVYAGIGECVKWEKKTSNCLCVNVCGFFVFTDGIFLCLQAWLFHSWAIRFAILRMSLKRKRFALIQLFFLFIHIVYIYILIQIMFFSYLY